MSLYRLTLKLRESPIILCCMVRVSYYSNSQDLIHARQRWMLVLTWSQWSMQWECRQGKSTCSKSRRREWKLYRAYPSIAQGNLPWRPGPRCWSWGSAFPEAWISDSATVVHQNKMTIIKRTQNKMQQRKVNSNRATGNRKVWSWWYGLVDDRRCF